MAHAERLWTDLQGQRLSVDERPRFTYLAESFLLADNVPHHPQLASGDHEQCVGGYPGRAEHGADANFIQWIRSDRARFPYRRHALPEHLVLCTSLVRSDRSLPLRNRNGQTRQPGEKPLA